MGEGRTEILPLLEMVCQQFRLSRVDISVVEIPQHGRDAQVAILPAAPQQAGIGHVTGQRVVERIDAVGLHAASPPAGYARTRGQTPRRPAPLASRWGSDRSTPSTSPEAWRGWSATPPR